MTAQNHLEQHGNFTAHPFAELLVEIVQAKLSGSLRVNHDDQKSIIYFRKGSIVYAVSNSKPLRLFNLLLRKKKIDTKVINRHPNFANDVEFAASLIGGRILARESVDETFTEQMREIVVEVLTWPGGEWSFSPLVRARDELAYNIDAYEILIDYARCTGSDHILRRFMSVQETFAAVPERRLAVNLQAHEAYVLARFEGQSLTIEQLRSMCSMPESGMLQSLYVLWLGGLIVRRDWNAAFSPTKIGEILTARVAKVKEAAGISAPQVTVPSNLEPTPPPEVAKAKLPATTLSLAEYLEQIEKAETHYDALGVGTDADAVSVKNAYFSFAKQFHPDRFHRESAETLRRIQSAFTVLAHAHETLKTPESRDAYNAKMYKEIDAREKRRAAGGTDISDPNQRKTEQGLESFEEGLSCLNDEDYESAAAFLARAVHYSPQNAQFHAYYGTALSNLDEKQRHKAEGSLQNAVKLDPKNTKIRLMLVDFLIEQKMVKRAEGELKRFLELVPGNKEAIAALAKLKG